MSTVLGFLALALAFVVVLMTAVRNRAWATPLLIGFFTRAALAIIDAHVYLLPGHDDSYHFDHTALYWARHGIAGTFEHITTGADLYTWVVSVMYAGFDRSVLMAQALNVVFGTLMILNVARLTLQLGGDPTRARQAAWLIALFPSLNYFSAVLLREIAVAYPLSLGVLYLARWYKERKSTQMLGAVVALLISMAFHSGSVAVLLAAGVWLVVAWIRSLFTQGFKNLGRNSLALIAGATAVAFVFSSGFGMGKFKHVESGEVERLSETQTYFAKGRTAYLEDLHPETGTDLALQTPLRVTYFLFAPFPWMLSAGSDVVGFIDSMFFMVCFYRIWRQRREFARRPDALLVLTVFSAMAVTFAIGVSNYGTALRHRNKMLPLLVGVAFAFPWRVRSGVPTEATPAREPSVA